MSAALSIHLGLYPLMKMKNMTLLTLTGSETSINISTVLFYVIGVFSDHPFFAPYFLPSLRTFSCFLPDCSLSTDSAVELLTSSAISSVLPSKTQPNLLFLIFPVKVCQIPPHITQFHWLPCFISASLSTSKPKKLTEHHKRMSPLDLP